MIVFILNMYDKIKSEMKKKCWMKIQDGENIMNQYGQ